MKISYFNHTYVSDTFKKVVDVCDRIPLVSTISSISILLFKYVIYPTFDALFGERLISQKNYFVASLLNRDLARDIELLIPGFGNILVFFLDAKKPTISDEETSLFIKTTKKTSPEKKLEIGKQLLKNNPSSYFKYQTEIDIEKGITPEQSETLTNLKVELIEKKAQEAGVPVGRTSTYKKIVESKPIQNAVGNSYERTGKNQKKKTLLLGKEIEQGGIKVCHKALQIGGKDPGRSKTKVLYLPVTGEEHEFQRDMGCTLAKSKKIRELAEKKGMMPHFLKYKEVSSNDPAQRNLMTADYIPDGDLYGSLPKLTTSQVYQIIKDLLNIGAFLEESKLSHRDFKLENLMLRDGKLVLIDIGAMVENDDKVLFFGTNAYIAPNIVDVYKHGALYSPLTEKQDNYAIGILLFELLSKDAFPIKPFGEALGAGNNAQFFIELPKLNVLVEKLKNSQQETPKIISLLCALLEPNVSKRLSLKKAKERFASLTEEDVNWKISCGQSVSVEKNT